MHLSTLAWIAVAFSSFSPRPNVGRETLWADFDRDGRPDVYLYGGQAPDLLLRNDGAGGFVDRTREMGLEGLRSRFALLRDLDGDGRPDLVRLDAQGTPRIHLAEPQGPFGLPKGEETARGLVELEARDLDGDGDTDLTGRTATGAVVVLENLGEGLYERSRVVALGASVPSSGSLLPAPTSGHAGSAGRSVASGRSGGGGRPTSAAGPASTGGVGAPAAGAPPPPVFGVSVARSLFDQANPGATLEASSQPTLGRLYPLSSDFYVDPTGNVGIGTTTLSSGTKLTVAGKVVFGVGASAPGSDAAVGGGNNNTASGPASTVSGGMGNTASGGWATVAGGSGNTAASQYSTVAGGVNNSASSSRATVTGGANNTASGLNSVVGGGKSNLASGEQGTVPGGFENVAGGLGSFAAGTRAEAVHNGTFVWASTEGTAFPLKFQSTGPDQFLIRAGGGVGIGTNAPLAQLHVGPTDLSLPSAATSLETIVAEDSDAILGLYSSDAGSYGSGLVLGEVVSGSLVNKWALVRRTGGVRNLELTFGTGAAYNANPTLFTFADEGDLRIGSTSTSELTLAQGAILQESGDLNVTAQGTLTLDASADVRIQGTAMYVKQGTGRVGIGTSSPAFLLHVNGSAGKPGGGSWSVASDERLKTHVEGLEGSLERLLRLRGVTYEYRDPEAIGELPGTQTGMIAQEVREVFPEWVEQGADGYLRLSVRGFEALTVEALRDLRAEKDAEIEDLRRSCQEQLARRDTEIEDLRRRLSRLESAFAEMTALREER